MTQILCFLAKATTFSKKSSSTTCVVGLDGKERMRIFNAYYISSDASKLLYDSITPVNTFRTIFNYYFYTDFKLLEDRNYYSFYGFPYQFTDVTTILKTPTINIDNVIWNEVQYYLYALIYVEWIAYFTARKAGISRRN